MPQGQEIGNRDGTQIASEVTAEVSPEAAGERLDRWLALTVPDLSRSRAQALIAAGCVAGPDGPLSDASQKLRAGQRVTVVVPPAAPAEPEAQEIPLDIVYEDAELLVLNKPPGLVVHPAAGNEDGTLVNALLAHCGDGLSGIGGVRRPGIVHRLDKDTSGLMVVAKTDRAHQGLSAQFADRTLSRTYTALVWGVPSPREGRIEGNIGRASGDRKRMAVVAEGGKFAATRYRVRRSFAGAVALLDCVLETGRTHQIRVHMTHIGHPLVGDPVYGRGRSSRVLGGRASGSRAAALPEPLRDALVGFARQALHAAEISFIHPASGQAMRFAAAPPADMAALIAGLERICGAVPEPPGRLF